MSGPVDPVTGRALLGGRAKRAVARRTLIAVTGFDRCHLFDMVTVRTLCGHANDGPPHTGGLALCGTCRRRAAQRGVS